MAIRLQTFFKDLDDNLFLLTIQDTDFVGTAIEDVTLREVKPSWTSDNEQLLSPMLPSELSVTIIINSAELQTLVEDMSLAEEGRFTLTCGNIVGFLTSTFTWNGYIMPDLLTYEDIPYTIGYDIEIRAKDGINRLKNLDYSYGIITPHGDPLLDPPTSQTFLEHIIKGLSKLTGLTSLYGGSDIFLKVICNWHEDSYTYASSINPLERARISHKAFYYIDTKNNFRFYSTYQVIEFIARAFRAVFFYSGKSYWFIQVNELLTPTAKTVFNYSKTGTLLSTTTEDLTIYHFNWNDANNKIVRLGGGNFQLEPALKYVQVDYEHISTRNLAPGVIFETGSDPFEFEELDDTVISSLLFDMVLTLSSHYNPDPPTDFQEYRIVFKFEVRVGTGLTLAYLKRDVTWSAGDFGFQYGATEWSADPAYYYYVVEESIKAIDQTIVPLKISFQTPPTGLPSPLYVDISLDSSTRYVDGTLVDLLTEINVTYLFSGLDIEMLFDGTLRDQNDVQRFKATNDNEASQKLEIATMMGDGPGMSTPTHIEVKDDSDEWVLSDAWRVGNSGTYVPITKLLVTELFKLQAQPILKFGQTKFRNTDHLDNLLLPHRIIDYDGSYWVMLKGSYDIKNNEITGSWLRLATGTNFTHQDVQFLPKGREEGIPTTGGTNGSGGSTSGSSSGSGGSSTASIPYHQRFNAHASATLTITENGGIIPTNKAKYKIFENGQLVSPTYFSISGSDIILTFTPDGTNFDVYFDYP